MSCKKCKENHKGDTYVYCLCECHKVEYLQEQNSEEKE